MRERTVYLVTNGEYSSYGFDRAFSTLDAAKAYAEMSYYDGVLEYLSYSAESTETALRDVVRPLCWSAADDRHTLYAWVTPPVYRDAHWMSVSIYIEPLILVEDG